LCAPKPKTNASRYLCTMATSSIFGHSRPAAFVVRRLAGKGKASRPRLAKAAPHECEPKQYMKMTKAEAEVFFAACENYSAEPIAMFDNLSIVAKWFKD